MQYNWDLIDLRQLKLRNFYFSSRKVFSVYPKSSDKMTFAARLDLNDHKFEFYGSIWNYYRVGYYLGFFPVEIYSENHEIKVKVSKTSTAYFLSIFLTFSILALHSHFTTSHDFQSKENPMIHRVAFFQVVTLSTSGAVGALSLFFKRHEHVEVGIKSLRRRLSREIFLQLMRRLNNISLALNRHGLVIQHKTYDRRIWQQMLCLLLIVGSSSFTICGAVHPFHESVWNQLKCSLVT